MKKILVLAAMLAAMLAAIGSTAYATAEMDITVKYNGTALCFNKEPVIINDKTLVQLRPVAEAMGLSIKYAEKTGSVILSDSETTVIFKQDSDKVIVNNEERKMDVPMVVRSDYTFVPVRYLVEPFGNSIDYDGESKTVSVTQQAKRPRIADKSPEEVNTVNETEEKQISTGSGNYKATYFYQSQPELALEGNGRGYCWVCSYAMLMSDALGETVTPTDVAAVNISRGYSGSFMSGHETLVAEFGCTLVPALAESSPYYGGFNAKNKGETLVNVSTDEDALSVIREALELHPYGVLVRYEGYPHTMVAVDADENNVYFNDPGIKNGEHVTFENTCLKNFKLSDISYIQAIEVK